jgi:hypothetical protein
MTCKEITESFYTFSQSATLRAHICMLSIYYETNNYSKFSHEAKGSLPPPPKQINGKCNDISSADANISL